MPDDSLLVFENKAKAELHANDMNMAKQAAEVLMREYPGWLWGVNVNGETGMCDIRNFNLSGNYGFRMKLKEIYSASSFEKDVIFAGGEILERYNQPRGAFSAQHWSGLKQDLRGIPIGDKSR